MTIVQPDKDETDLRVAFQPPTPEQIAAARPAKTVHDALCDVMADVQAVRKGQRNPEHGYTFRGIDAVVNAVGPALRKHRVLVLPGKLLSVSHRDVLTSRGKPSRECTVEVRYTIVGPDGSELEVEAPGESMDTGDKGTAKAMSVAYRIALLQTLCIPTDEPDPDEHTYERGNAAEQEESGPILPDELVNARKAVAEAWALHRGAWNQDAATKHFAVWSNGEELEQATAERLDEYAAALAATEEPA